MKAAVVTVSDRAFSGERADSSGPVLVKRLEQAGYPVTEYRIVSDDFESIKDTLIELSDEKDIDLILTTGGTGVAPRDITPEATLSVSEKNVPGISEAIRAFSLTKTRHAMLSRGVSVIRKGSLIINLPGSPRACEQSMEVIEGALGHALGLIRGEKLDG